MNTFAIRNPKELKLIDMGVLSKKDREPNEAPGVQLAWMGEFSQAVLNQFADGLAGMIFEPGEQSGFDEESDLTGLSDIAKGLSEFGFKVELTGYSGAVNFGATEKGAIPFESAMLHAFLFFPKEGGTVLVKFKMDIPNAGEKVLGKFGVHKSQRGELTLFPPEVKEETKPDAAQMGLMNADTPPKTRVPSPFKNLDGAEEGAQDGQTDEGTDTPAKALARAHKVPK